MAKANENDKKITKYLLIGLGVVVFLAMVGSSSDKSKTTETKPEESVKEVVATPTPEPAEVTTATTPEPTAETTIDAADYLIKIKTINDKFLNATTTLGDQFSNHTEELMKPGTSAQSKVQNATQKMIDGYQEVLSLTPPAKYEEFHQLLTDACKDWNDSSVLIQESLKEDDLSKKSDIWLKAIPLNLSGQEKYNKAADLLESLNAE